MAEVSNLHRHRHPPSPRRPVSNEPIPHPDETHLPPNPFVLDFDSFSPPTNFSNPSFFDDYATSLDFGFDLAAETENLGCEYEDPNCFFFGGDEDEEQMNFVTDLFETRQTLEAEDLVWDLDSGRVEDSFEFGFGPGLRVVGSDSESDSEEFGVNDADESYGSFVGRENNDHENEREEFEWEEVSERINFDERENLNLVINRIEEISVSSDISSSEVEGSSFSDDDGGLEEEEQSVEWEFLLAMNNLERAFEGENENSGSGVAARNNLPEDYILTMEYDTLFGQLVENENALKGSPPAAKSVVENLPIVVLTKDEIGENNSVCVCAVCKDEFAAAEKVTRMPCCHMYHGDCILPWLSIRNTCPVCRYELPTDDAEYEKRRSERVGNGIASRVSDDFEVRYNFELLP